MEHRRPQIDHELLLAQSGWVQGLARNLVRDPLGAEDVAQDTMLAALAAPPEAEDVRSLRAWLARVVTNLANLTTRRSARRRRREEWAAQPESVSSTVEIVERASQMQLVVESVLELDEPYRSTLLLRFYDGLSTSQIADRTGASQVAVRKRLSRGVERLRRNLDEDNDGDRRAWMAAMLPLAFRVPPPSPAGWLDGLRTATVATAALTLAGVSALVAFSLARSPAAGLPAAPSVVAGQAEHLEVPAPAAEGQPGESVLLGSVIFEEAERRLQLPVQPGERIEPHTPTPIAPPPTWSLRGRVVDLAGFGVGGMELVDASHTEAVLGTSDVHGEFALEVDHLGFHLAANGPGFVTLREASIDEWSPGRDLVLVATTSVDVAGWVQDTDGRPLEGAEVAIEVPESVYLDLPVPVERTRLARRSVLTDAAGNFRFQEVASAPGIALRTSLEGYADDQRAVPELSRVDLDIVLGFAAPPATLLEGVVVLPGGVPAPGAKVRVGSRVVRADESGRFEIPVEPASPARPTTIVAEVEGWQPAVEILEPSPGSALGPGAHGNRSADAPSQHYRRLRISSELLAISGHMFGPDGRPMVGWRVVASDEEGDPRFPELPPGAPVQSAHTGGDGGFTLGGLLDRSYTLRAYDPVSLASAESTSIVAGSRGVVLRSRTAGSPEAARGLVVTADGAPLPYARITPFVETGGGMRAFGTPITAGADGGFHLPGREPRPPILVEHQEGMVAMQVFGNGSSVVVPLEAWFVFAGGPWKPRPDSMSVLDQDGVPLMLHSPDLSATRLPLSAGRSPAIRTTDDGETLVVYLRNKEVARLPVRLIAGELVVVGGRGAASKGQITPAATERRGGQSKISNGPSLVGLSLPGSGEGNGGNSVTPEAQWQP